MMKFWTLKITTFVLWALSVGTAAFWVLQSLSQPAASSKAKPFMAVTSAPDLGNSTQVALALGAKNPIAPTAAGALAALQARLQLLGILSVGDKSGAALIAVDGKPAKPYRMGSAVEDGLSVMSIKARSVAFGQNGTEAFTLDLPLKK